jgi:hypothetical protein
MKIIKQIIRKIKINLDLLDFEEDLMARERTTVQHLKMLYCYTFR